MTGSPIVDVILAIGFVGLVVGVVVYFFRTIRKGATDRAERESAERSLNEANEQADSLAAAPLGGRAQLDVLDRLSDD